MRTRQNRDHPLAGRRFRLLAMPDDPAPVPAGSTGTVDSAVDTGDAVHLNVTWDPGVGRSLNVVTPPDVIEWIDDV